jgi:hypothetical protein
MDRITFKPLVGRRCELSFVADDSVGREIRAGLLFDGVEAYKCTYMSSLSVEMIRAAYGRLVRLEQTPWLGEVSGRSARHYEIAKQPPRRLQHLMICFDDGPCYEILCVSFGPFGCEQDFMEQSKLRRNAKERAEPETLTERETTND